MEQKFFQKSVPKPDLPAPAGELWDLVASLTVRQRQVVILRHVAELKETEIGAVLGISRGTVSSTLHDAHQRLGRLLDDDNES
jgi:RNA polymerase sigma factor (sigma-70 family)